MKEVPTTAPSIQEIRRERLEKDTSISLRALNDAARAAAQATMQRGLCPARDKYDTIESLVHTAWNLISAAQQTLREEPELAAKDLETARLRLSEIQLP
jgi:hypothetical protein